MRRVWPVLFLSALLAGAMAQAQVYPFKLKLAEKHIDVGPDGSSVMTQHTEVELLDGAPVAQLSTQTVPYFEGVQDAVITEAYTRKPDGRQIPVDLRTVGTERAPSAGMLQKVIAFPAAATGDTLVYTVLSRTKPTLPGGYMYSDVISPSLGRDDTRLTISVPKTLPLTFDSHGVTIVETSTWGGTTYSVSFAVKAPVSDEGQYVSRADRERRFAFSSYKSYDELAAAYAKLVLPKIAVTAKIQALADQITAGVEGHRAQAERIHLWIATHLAYVDEAIGAGRYVPHDADAVLTAGRGDCKDHAVLFLALAKAKGIDGEYVLIDAGNAYVLSEAASLSAFDHVIVWLPEFGAYVDPTAHAAPFGVLQSPEYGKAVLHIGGQGGALQRTPVLTDSTIVNTTIARLDEQGGLSVTSGVKARGPVAIALRQLGDRMRARGPEEYLTGGLLVNRLKRASGTFSLPPAGDLSPEYSLSATYTTAPEARLLAGDAVPRPDNVTTIPPAEAAFAGPIADTRYANADPVPCYSGTARDDLSLELPATSTLAGLPRDTAIKTANIEYTSHWSLDGRMVRVHREYRAHFSEPLCSGPMRVEAVNALARIRDDYRQEIRVQPANAR